MREIIILALIFFGSVLILGALLLLFFIIKDRKELSEEEEAISLTREKQERRKKLNKHSKTKSKTPYIDAFRMYYKETRSVPDTLEAVAMQYKPKDKRRAAIEEAVNYLRYSLFRDYATAFSIIEEDVNEDGLFEFHQEIIETVRKSRMLQIEPVTSAKSSA